MIILALLILGLMFGSFINALVWRLWQQTKTKSGHKTIKGKKVDITMSKGRSVCVHCGHELAWIDLVPLLSWLSLRGKCRYCKKKIDDSPLVELFTAGVFTLSNIAWPYELGTGLSWLAFALWLVIAVGLVALFVYDIKHLLLPDKIVFPLMGLAIVLRVILMIDLDVSLTETVRSVVLGLLAGGGLFYLLFQISGGRWIGGGDVKLGFVIGILLGPINALVALLVAVYVAAGFIFPLMLIGKVSRKSKIPFGPFLIIGFVIGMLWAESIRDWYSTLFHI